MQPQQPYYGPPAAPQPQPNYDFIVNPAKPPRASLSGPTSTLGRVLVIGGFILVLIIVFVVIKGVLSGGGNKDAMIHVEQDQQSIIHLTTNAALQQNISTVNQNFAVTAQIALTSQQSQLTDYLKTQHQTISIKQRNLKVSTSLDTQLTNAQAASTYDVTFQQIMQSQLTDYEAALNLAFKQTPGPKGRALLKTQYQTATLLQTQLSTPSS